LREGMACMGKSVEDVRGRFALAVKEHLGDALINFSTAILIWLFGVLVYLPLAFSIEPRNLPMICSLIILTVFSIFMFRGIEAFKPILNLAPAFLAQEYKKIRKSNWSIERLKDVFECIMMVLVIVIVYALYYPLIAIINPSLNGIILIPILIWIFLLISKTITTKSE